MATDIKKMKNKLEDEREILVTELKGLGRLDTASGKWEAVPIVAETELREADENDLADHEEDFEERSATLNTLAPRLEEVERALRKIAENKYGRCENCGEEIEEDRLEANPAAPTCKRHMNL